MKDTDGKLMELEMDTSEPVLLSFHKEPRHTRAIEKLSCQSKLPGTFRPRKRLSFPGGTLSVTKGDAELLLRQHGSGFVKKFLETNPTALSLISKEPSVCWAYSGLVHFAAVAEHSGPTTIQNNSPLLFRIHVDLYPALELRYQLNSAVVRRKLGVPSTAGIATEPALEVTVTPEEVDRLGTWVPAWFDAYFRPGVPVPKPPIALIAWNGIDKPKDLMSAGGRWRHWLCLQSLRAHQLFEHWLKN
ncbi:MAG: hypothetical protein FJ271_28275 [Planctomycetes bacterium]|nr:hypothetical protein [Planctomycetota bacterium]